MLRGKPERATGVVCVLGEAATAGKSRKRPPPAAIRVLLLFCVLSSTPAKREREVHCNKGARGRDRASVMSSDDLSESPATAEAFPAADLVPFPAVECVSTR